MFTKSGFHTCKGIFSVIKKQGFVNSELQLGLTNVYLKLYEENCADSLNSCLYNFKTSILVAGSDMMSLRNQRNYSCQLLLKVENM